VGTLKVLKVAGIRVTNERNIEFIAATEQGYIAIELPGEATAILSALFSAYAYELGIGGKEEKEHATLNVFAYEICQPTLESCPLLLKCRPDLNLWFTLPVQALEDMGHAFLGVSKIAASLRSDGSDPDAAPTPPPAD
jgi:hypothetical protein